MDDPDWMNDFKTPTENVLLHLSSSSPSSSPSREVKGKAGRSVRTGEERSVSSGQDGSDDEDSPLISALKTGRKLIRAQEKSPVRQSVKLGRRKAVEDDDDEEESPKVESRRPKRKRKKRGLESEEENEEEYQIPPKVRKTSASPQVKKAIPKTGRKGRRVSISEEEGIPQLKGMKGEVPLGGPPVVTEKDDEQPISSLVRKKGKRPTDAAKATVSPSVGLDDSKAAAVPRGATGLAALRDPGGATADGEDALLTKEEANHEDQPRESSQRKGKQRASADLPVILAEKVHRTKVLLECEGDTLDLSGDMGAVGRFAVSSGKEKGEDDLFLDLKGIIYKTTIVPSNTFFVVNVGHAEAKVGAMMNDFMQLRPDVNQVQDETLVEGTLEGFELDNDNDCEALSTPVTASGPVDSNADEDDTKQKKKTPTKLHKQKKGASKGCRGSRAKGAGKGGNGSSRRSRRKGKESKRRGKGITSKKPRAKAKVTTKKPSKTKTTAAKSVQPKES